ncbi:MAG: SPW repeat protein [Ethanoligenens sp.]
MERIWKCAHFALARIWKSAVIITIIYFAFIIGLTTLINAVTPDGPKTVQSSLILFVVIYTFFFMYSLYKNMWNNLLLFGNTRTTSFGGILLATLCADAAFAILSVLSDGFTVVWSRVMHFTGGSIYGILDPQASPIQGVWYYFCLLFAVSCFGLLYGTLFYKIGRAFHAIFWIAFATFWSVGIPLCSKPILAAAASWYTGYHHIAAASLHALITGAVFAVIAYLLARRQPLRA